MRYLRTSLLALGLTTLVAGCGITDLNINKSPNAATEAPGNLLLPTVLATIASNRSIEMQPATAEFVQIWASNGSAGVFTDPEIYVISPFTAGNVWGAYYGTVLRNLSLLRDQSLASEPAKPNAAAQAEIVAAYTYLSLTELYGSIPYTEALNGTEFPNPHFDDQETVLRGIVAKLDSAVAIVNPAGNGAVVTGDLVYDGDMDNWVRFANSLKLRTLMLIRNKDASVDAQISALLSQPLIRTVSQEAEIPYFNTANNENNLWRLNFLFQGFTGFEPNGNGFIFAGKTLVDMMEDLGDPRLDTYFQPPLDSLPNGGHIGQAAGVFTYADVSSVSQNIIRKDWPSRIATAAETWLYDAEFKASTGDLAGASTAYLAGVQAGLDYFDGKPGAISDADKKTYLESLPQSFTSAAEALDAIHAQQYIEVMDRAPENWAQWKRTHYPALPLPVNAQLGDIIRRFPYPTAELNSNPNAPTNPPLDQPMWFEK